MRKIRRLAAALFLLMFLLPLSLLAQDRTLTGKVLADGTNAPMQGVTIRVKGTSRFTQTDAQGNFSISVRPGETRQLSHVGYEAIDIKPGAGNTVAVFFFSSVVFLGAVSFSLLLLL